MRHPNYNHLLYFWTVVREGGIARAAEALHITPQTISGQIKLLEEQLQGTLFEKQGRRLVPTDLGKVAFQYAEDIFSRGLELASVLRGALPLGRRSVTIGISDAVPKLISWRVLTPLTEGEQPFRIICHEGPFESLLADLAAHRLDLVLSSSAVPSDAGIKAFSHLLGESDLTFFAAASLAKSLTGRFPRSLDHAPFLLPTDRSANRRVLDTWFEKHGVTPAIVGEFDDTALIKTFAQAGSGVFVAPSAIEEQIRDQYDLVALGRTDEMRAKFYAISTERRIKHPAVAVITEQARSDLFRALPALRPSAAAARRSGRAPS
jgi:LysR family transcriptional regulator, transcriptional activator of nhaA